jgi:hypothetical protein
MTWTTAKEVGMIVVSVFFWLYLNSFIEDRLATLKNVIKEPALDKWNLYLGKSCFLANPLSKLICVSDVTGAVTWGYTLKEREEGQGILRIQLVDLPGISKKLK